MGLGTISGRFAVEQCEPRSLLSAVLVSPPTASDSRIIVDGTGAAEQITVVQSGTLVGVKVGNAPLASFESVPGGTARKIGLIFIDAGGGDDKVLIDASVLLPVYVNGGSGNDRLTGGGGKSNLYGGPGNDTLYGGAKENLLNGDTSLSRSPFVGGPVTPAPAAGTGDDRLFGGPLNDVLAGGAGDDDLYGGAGLDVLSGNAGRDGLFGGVDTSKDLISGDADDRFLVLAGTSDSYLNAPAVGFNDGRILFTNGDRAWTDKEIASVDEGFGWLQRRTKSTLILTYSGALSITCKRVKSLTGTVLAENGNLSTLQFADAAFTNSIPAGASAVHEIAHDWDSSSEMDDHTGPSEWKTFTDLSGWKALPVGATVTSGYNRALTDGYGHASPWQYLKTAPFSRNYGRTNPQEDFATSVEGYYALATGTGGTNYAPKADWLAKWNFVDAFLTRTH